MKLNCTFVKNQVTVGSLHFFFLLEKCFYRMKANAYMYHGATTHW